MKLLKTKAAASMKIGCAQKPDRICVDSRKKENGFTLLEMMVVLVIVTILLLITLPNIQQKEKIIRAKGCDALIEVVNSQILLYEIDTLQTPSSVSELISGGYLKEGQDRCPDGSMVVITNGQASH